MARIIPDGVEPVLGRLVALALKDNPKGDPAIEHEQRSAARKACELYEKKSLTVVTTPRVASEQSSTPDDEVDEILAALDTTEASGDEHVHPKALRGIRKQRFLRRLRLDLLAVEDLQQDELYPCVCGACGEPVGNARSILRREPRAPREGWYPGWTHARCAAFWLKFGLDFQDWDIPF